MKGKNNRNNARAKARIRHRKSYYVEIVSDTKMRIYSALEVASMMELNPKCKDIIKDFIRFDNKNSAIKYVNKQLGFQPYFMHY